MQSSNYFEGDKLLSCIQKLIVEVNLNCKHRIRIAGRIILHLFEMHERNIPSGIHLGS